jgi:predicted Ser/Thr protein kinase
MPPLLDQVAEGEESLPLGASGKEIDNREVRLIRQLGRGQYGTVFEGECRAKRVAVKVFEGNPALLPISK